MDQFDPNGMTTWPESAGQAMEEEKKEELLAARKAMKLLPPNTKPPNSEVSTGLWALG